MISIDDIIRLQGIFIINLFPRKEYFQSHLYLANILDKIKCQIPGAEGM